MSRDLELVGEQIAEMAAHLDAAMHGLLTHVRVFDVAGGWFRQGALSCAHWLSWRVGWDLGTARERVRVARRLGELPLIDDALRRGELSYTKVRAMTRVATTKNEATLVEEARFTTGEQLEKICRKYAAVQRHDTEHSPKDDRDRRYVTRRELDSGMVRIEAVLHPEEACLVWAVLDRIAARRCQASSAASTGTSATQGHGPGGSAETSSLGSTTSAETASRSSARQSAFDRADALVELAEGYARGDHRDRAPIELVLTVCADTLAEAPPIDEVAVMQDGTCISPEAVRRLACDSGIVRVVEDADGNPLAVGRKTRSISGTMKRALVHRDRTCCFPGCTNRLFLEGHHHKHWAMGGETSMDNVSLLCTRHHRYVHEYGYRIERDECGRPVFVDPRGRPVAGEPATRVSNPGWPTLRAMNRDLDITADTSACGWDGMPVNYSYAIDDLVHADR